MLRCQHLFCYFRQVCVLPRRRKRKRRKPLSQIYKQSPHNYSSTSTDSIKRRLKIFEKNVSALNMFTPLKGQYNNY
jgi:hypothetical protein